MNNNIYNKNAKGQLHGYNEWYWKGKLSFKCFYNDARKIDYEEYYYRNGELEKRFHI